MHPISLYKGPRPPFTGAGAGANAVVKPARPRSWAVRLASEIPEAGRPYAFDDASKTVMSPPAKGVGSVSAGALGSSGSGVTGVPSEEHASAPNAMAIATRGPGRSLTSFLGRSTRPEEPAAVHRENLPRHEVRACEVEYGLRDVFR